MATLPITDCGAYPVDRFPGLGDVYISTEARARLAACVPGGTEPDPLAVVAQDLAVHFLERLERGCLSATLQPEVAIVSSPRGDWVVVCSWPEVPALMESVASGDAGEGLRPEDRAAVLAHAEDIEEAGW